MKGRMSKLAIVVIAFISFCSFSFANPSKCNAPLRDVLRIAQPDEIIPALILMSERPDLSELEEMVHGLPRKQRTQLVWQELVELSKTTQEDLLDYLSGEMDRGSVQEVKSLRICNGVIIRAYPDVIRNLALREDIYKILDNRERVHPVPPVYEGSLDELDEVGWNRSHIQVDEAWADGYTGEGILVAHIDTGCNYRHFDIRGHLWDGGEEYPNGGWDFYNGDNEPEDEDGHGTSVIGILGGDGTAGDTTGMAPNATLMVLKVRETLALGTVTDTWLAHDFCLEHSVDVTQMSLGWGTPDSADYPIWRDNFTTLALAGISSVKSGGNNRGMRQPPGALSVPGSVPSPWRNSDEVEEGTRSGLISSAAIDENNEVLGFSSPGPCTWQDIDPYNDYLFDTLGVNVGLIKPDISVPGVDIATISSWDSTAYGAFGMTSSTAPQISGVIALLLSKDQELLPVEIDSLLETTALDLGDEGKDNDYGAGLLQAVDALDEIDVPLGTLSGIVTDNNSGEPLEGARVFMQERPRRHGFSDIDGNYSFEVQTGTYLVLVRYGYNPEMATEEVVITEGEETELDIDFFSGIFSVSPESLEVTLQFEPVDSMELTFSNEGTVPISVVLEVIPATEDTFEYLEIYSDLNLEEEVDNDALHGLAWVNGEFFVSATVDGGDNQIYRFNTEGEYLGSFDQGGNPEDRVGMHDLAFDGNYLWGSIDANLYAMDIETGEVVSQIEGPYEDISVIAYDTDRDLLWVGHEDNDIISIDPENGDEMDTLFFNRDVFGMAYYPDAEDNYKLFLVVRRNNFNPRDLYKANPDSGDIQRTVPLPAGDDETVAGLTVAFGLDKYFDAFAG
ncbi:MAG: S8 family serine peptidase, partial [Candidatus Electryonea clarkiae]|nr:S8 family serine peptidase [Candidatus Electryonea clarkiae]